MEEVDEEVVELVKVTREYFLDLRRRKEEESSCKVPHVSRLATTNRFFTRVSHRESSACFFFSPVYRTSFGVLVTGAPPGLSVTFRQLVCGGSITC